MKVLMKATLSITKDTIYSNKPFMFGWILTFVTARLQVDHAVAARVGFVRNASSERLGGVEQHAVSVRA